MKKILLFYLFFSILSHSFTQGLYIPRDIKKAYDTGSRSMDGNPGPNYFQNRVNYRIEAEFDPATRLLKGSEKITYTNNSGSSLSYFVIRLYQNVFKRGTVRGREVDPSDTNNGVKITNLIINGKKCNLESDGCLLHETQTNIFLPFNCPANSDAEIEIDWEFIMPSKPNDRFGGYDENTFFMGYWFPQVSVFDDINHWDTFDYNAVAEFYNEYGDFDVKITVPENYIVWSTGTLQNPKEVLEKKYFNRYVKSHESDDVVHIITANDRKDNKEITLKGLNSWHFKSENVNDFAFGTSSRYLWDAAGMNSRSGKKIFIQSAYDPEFISFDKVVDIAHRNIEELETKVIGVDYPYPSMTIFNGIGGMEYPMIINDHDGNLVESIFVTSHEIAHSYFPFLVGTNQHRHGWFDEGLITMLGMEVHNKRDSTMNLRGTYTEYYAHVAGTQIDIPQLVNSIDLSDNVFQLHEYVRPSLAFWTLRDIMGNEMYKKSIKEFIRRWEGKHPTPWDFFFTVNDFSGEDYSWFFQAWFFNFAYPDLAVESATYENDILEIKIKNAGGIPFPCKMNIIYSDGSSNEKYISGKQWSQSDLFSLREQSLKQPVKIHLDTSGYPDCNELNNTFEIKNSK
jgi:hypothetical protein